MTTQKQIYDLAIRLKYTNIKFHEHSLSWYNDKGLVQDDKIEMTYQDRNDVAKSITVSVDNSGELSKAEAYKKLYELVKGPE